MDLSTGKRIDETREAILGAATVPIGTVPIYQAIEQVKSPEDLTGELLLEVIEHQAHQGVDYMSTSRRSWRSAAPTTSRSLSATACALGRSPTPRTPRSSQSSTPSASLPGARGRARFR